MQLILLNKFEAHQSLPEGWMSWALADLLVSHLCSECWKMQSLCKSWKIRIWCSWSDVQCKNYHTQDRKQQRKGELSSAVCGLFIAWLLAFADRVGDKLPFGDGIDATVQIRLPFLNKKVVSNINYRNFDKTDNVTSVSPTIHKRTATLAWKNDPNAKAINNIVKTMHQY